MPFVFLLLSLVNQSTGVVELPKGTIEIAAEVKLPAGAHDLEIRGADTVLRAGSDFRGRAILSCSGCRNIKITGITFDGNRSELAKPAGLPEHDQPFSRFTVNNGILMENADGLVIRQVKFQNIAGFAVLVSHSTDVLIEETLVENSGSLNQKGRNNTTGGILLEEQTEHFDIRKCTLKNILGNGIWTHSLYKSKRNHDGRINNNTFEDIGRDAIQIGHATRINVEGNSGKRIGFPIDKVDMEGGGTPVGIDTAGNVENARYAGNHFEEINGKCIDLDGFHDGEVLGNVCINNGKPEDYPYGHYAIVMNNTNPDMQPNNIKIMGNQIDGTKFGGIFLIGTGHTVKMNLLTRLNLAHCNENTLKFSCLSFKDDPDILQSGIYLGRGAERPAPSHDSIVEGNVISGFNMDKHCITAAPGVKLESHQVNGNKCKGQ
ncbi:MAG: right-handed parallel beta-helix repeat-containing protein [Bryobacteraceae bacterium]